MQPQNALDLKAVEKYARKYKKSELVEQAKKLKIKNPDKYAKLELAAFIVYRDML